MIASYKRKAVLYFLAKNTLFLLLQPQGSYAYTNPTTPRKSIFDKLRKGPPISIQEELGTSPTFQYEYFDPLELANDDNFAMYREAELKHGRIAMLATIGMTFTEWNIHLNLPLSVHANIGAPFPGDLSPSSNLQFSDVPSGIGAVPVVPWEGWLQILVFVGVLETSVFIQKSEFDMPGDYQTGYFGLIDKAQNQRSLLVELEHCRLAMIAFLFQVLLEVTTGETVLSQWR